MDFASFLGGVPSIDLGLGGTDGDARAEGGRGPTLGSYNKSGVTVPAVVGIVGAVLVGLYLLKRFRK